MKPIVKKIAAAVAIKEGIEKVQEMRKPKKPSFLARLMPFAVVAAVVGLGLFTYKSKFSGSSQSGPGSNGSAPPAGGSF